MDFDYYINILVRKSFVPLINSLVHTLLVLTLFGAPGSRRLHTDRQSVFLGDRGERISTITPKGARPAAGAPAERIFLNLRVQDPPV